jgi:predicted membrane channel-forming protein YqfA (hemolysin III family)
MSSCKEGSPLLDRKESLQHMDTKRPAAATTDRLLSWHEIPSWLQDNHYILANYRGPSHSLRKSLSSLFYLHTEFVNIHTHLIGALVLALIGFPVYQSISVRYESFSWKDCLAFGIWFLCAILCLGMSATYHTICNHSPGYNAFSQKLDHLGIIILTSGSFLSMIYYGWYCEPQLAYTFSTMVKPCRLFASWLEYFLEEHATLFTDFRADRCLVSGLCNNIRKSKDSYSQVATLSCWNVHCSGPVCSCSHHTWRQLSRRCWHELTDHAIPMACTRICVLSSRGMPLCGRLRLSPRLLT